MGNDSTVSVELTADEVFHLLQVLIFYHPTDWAKQPMYRKLAQAWREANGWNET